MIAANPEKADLPHGSPLIRNGRRQPCAFGVGNECPPGPRIAVAGHDLCPEHIERLRAIAADADVCYNFGGE